MLQATKRFPKPAFADLLDAYRTDPESVHTCAILNPTPGPDGINTCAARMSEALCLANRLVDTRLSMSSKRVKNEVFPLLGPYGFRTYGNLCSHGIARGARDLSEFLARAWGSPREWTKQNLSEPPAEIIGKRGVICFIKIPGYGGQGHIDLFNENACVGSGYWDAERVWFLQMT